MSIPKGLWPKELQKALWALRTSPTRVTSFSPFKLLFGNEAMTPGDLVAKSLRAIEDNQPEGSGISLDLLEEHRVQAIATMAKYTEGVM